MCDCCYYSGVLMPEIVICMIVMCKPANPFINLEIKWKILKWDLRIRFNAFNQLFIMFWTLSHSVIQFNYITNLQRKTAFTLCI